MLAGEKLKKAVESVIRDMNVRPPGIVDLQCTEEHLRDLSRDVHDWKNIIGYLGFEKTRRVQAEIISDCRGLLEQTTEMFLRWRDRHGVNATYRKLIEVFVGKVQNRVYAERLCEIVCVSPPEGVEILLIVCNENENAEVKKLLTDQQVKSLQSNSESITLGKFAGRNVALLYTKQGFECIQPVVTVLRELKQVDKVIAVGVAYGADREKQLLGDIIVSKKIVCGGNVKAAEEISFRGDAIGTKGPLYDYFCKEVVDLPGNEFSIPEEQRCSKVHCGTLLSAPILWNEAELKERLLATCQERAKVVGGEMEGWALLEAAAQVEDWEKRNGGCKRTIVPIVIKGVSDYGDGGKKKDDDKKWQPIAAKAAATYVKFKLQQHPI